TPSGRACAACSASWPRASASPRRWTRTLRCRSWPRAPGPAWSAPQEPGDSEEEVTFKFDTSPHLRCGSLAGVPDSAARRRPALPPDELLEAPLQLADAALKLG